MNKQIYTSKVIGLFFLVIFHNFTLHAQGILRGQVLNERKEPMINASVQPGNAILTKNEDRPIIPSTARLILHPISDNVLNDLYQQIQNRKNAYKPDEPGKRTFTREEINHMPH